MNHAPTLMLLLTPIFGGVLLGAFLQIRRNLEELAAKPSVASHARILGRILLLLAGFYLFAGLDTASLALCLLGFSLAQFELSWISQAMPKSAAPLSRAAG